MNDYNLFKRRDGDVEGRRGHGGRGRGGWGLGGKRWVRLRGREKGDRQRERVGEALWGRAAVACGGGGVCGRGGSARKAFKKRLREGACT